MKIGIIFGTRPEIIKLLSTIKECKRQEKDYFLVHTGQHYSYEMDKVFFEELGIEDPKYNLEVGSGTHATQTAKIMQKCEEVFQKEKPDVVFVQGDTNTVFGAAVAAAKMHIKVAHVEAGLRSGDMTMPEELNRIMVDHISDYCFAPTEEAKKNLEKEGIKQEKIIVTGNTVVDALYEVKEKIGPQQKEDYILVTAHRQENVDDKEKLSNIIKALDKISRKHNLRIKYPIHPRTQKMIDQFGIKMPDSITLEKPTGYLDFVKAQLRARLVLTDSGGVQEESCILGVPCVTLRENTERPETIEVGANVLAGTDPDRILEQTETMLKNEQKWQNPFGDGKAAKRMLETIE